MPRQTHSGGCVGAAIDWWRCWYSAPRRHPQYCCGGLLVLCVSLMDQLHSMVTRSKERPMFLTTITSKTQTGHLLLLVCLPLVFCFLLSLSVLLSHLALPPHFLYLFSFFHSGPPIVLYLASVIFESINVFSDLLLSCFIFCLASCHSAPLPSPRLLFLISKLQKCLQDAVKVKSYAFLAQNEEENRSMPGECSQTFSNRWNMIFISVSDCVFWEL